MKKSEAEAAMPALIDKWRKATSQPDSDGKNYLSFGDFWTWLQNNHHQYTQFRAKPNARYVTEMWFDDETKQTWRN